MYSKMKNNLVELLPDPIFIEFESSSDKDASIKTIAFKYFSGNTDLAREYLGHSECENVSNLAKNSFTISLGDYHQPELI